MILHLIYRSSSSLTVSPASTGVVGVSSIQTWLMQVHSGVPIALSSGLLHTRRAPPWAVLLNGRGCVYFALSGSPDRSIIGPTPKKVVLQLLFCLLFP